MKCLHKKGTEQLSCFRPIRLILRPLLSGRNEKSFKDFPTKNGAWRSLRTNVVASAHMNTQSKSKSPSRHTYTPPPVSPVHTGCGCHEVIFYILRSSAGVEWCGTGCGWFITESPQPNTWGMEEQQCRLGWDAQTHAHTHRHTCSNGISRGPVSLYKHPWGTCAWVCVCPPPGLSHLEQQHHLRLLIKLRHTNGKLA